MTRYVIWALVAMGFTPNGERLKENDEWIREDVGHIPNDNVSGFGRKRFPNAFCVKTYKTEDV